MSEPQRWTVYRYGAFDWHLGRPLDRTLAETVDVMPVSEHEALRDAARLVVDAEYRREQWGSDTVATFDRAIQALRESLK